MNGRRNNGERGFVLISFYIILVSLIALSGALVAHATAEMRSAQRSQASTQALYLAEAGVDWAITQLRGNYAWGGGTGTGTNGTYTVAVEVMGNRRRVNSQGTSTFVGDPVNRSVQSIVQQWIPPSFYDNVIWASQDIDLNGNAYVINGSVRHGDTTPSGTGNVNGPVTYDPATNPLPRLSFPQLFTIASSQNNVYDAERLANGHGVFPTSFWYRPPGTNGPEDPGMPNVNYVTTDLVLNGNIGTIGGFFVVVGNVLTNPSAVEDTTINGNGQIAGAIYTTGNFRINGGGAGFNINGGVWAGDQARVNGSATMSYNYDYMNAIRLMQINADVQVVSWQDVS